MTHYELDGAGMESLWGEGGGKIFHTRAGGCGADTVSCTMGIGSYPTVKRPGRCVKHPHQIAPRLKKD